LASDESDGEFQVALDGIVLGNVEVPNSGGWQNWTTITKEYQLTAGIHALRLTSQNKNNWNINRIEVKNDITTDAFTEKSNASLMVWPNPTKSNITIKGTKDEEVLVLNISGEMINVRMTNENTIDLSGQQSGIYFLKIGERLVKVIKK
jgi:hypothetical protein